MNDTARDKGTKLSERVLKLPDWSVICTNIPSELLTLEEGFVLMRTRWQIELVFKLWKSEGRIDEWRSEKPYRILCDESIRQFYRRLNHCDYLAYSCLLSLIF